MSGYWQTTCDGCGENNPAYKRNYWQVCEQCRTEYDGRKKENKDNLTLKKYASEAHRYRISGSLHGDSVPEEMDVYEIKVPIIAEDICQWCAVAKALMAFDPWAFEYVLMTHADDVEHSEWDVNDFKMDHFWQYPKIDLIIEDLGVIGEDVWNSRFNYPRLVGMR